MQNRVAQQGSEWAIDSIWPFQLSVAEAELAKLRRHMNLKRRLDHVQTIVALILVSICLFTILTSGPRF